MAEPTFETIKDALPPVFRKGLALWERLWAGDDTRELQVKTISGNAIEATATKTADYTIVLTDNAIFASGADNTVTITLPTAVGIAGRTFSVKCVDDTNAVDVATDGSEEIDGSATNFALINHEVLTLRSDGANWWLI